MSTHPIWKMWLDCRVCPTRKTVRVLAMDTTPRKELETAPQEAHQELESFSYSITHDMRARIHIKDHGIGIDPSFHEKISACFIKTIPVEAEGWLPFLGNQPLRSPARDILPLSNNGSSPGLLGVSARYSEN